MSKDFSIWKEGHLDRVPPIGGISAKKLKFCARLSEVKLADESLKRDETDSLSAGMQKELIIRV